jgi:hypothetical protein
LSWFHFKSSECNWWKNFLISLCRKEKLEGLW